VSAQLPVRELTEPILRTLSDGNRLVLVAPTGSGKTTQVPQMLLDASPRLWPELPAQSGGAKIVVLQPRRVAARTVAARVAWERKCSLGSEVGYQIRFEDRSSAGTRIQFVTEGILLRWLQDDPRLRGVHALLFDEFHERNLLSDVALAIVRDIQAQFRPDLKLVVMSATLDAEPVAAYLGGCPILESAGQTHPVSVVFQKSRDDSPAPEQAAATVEQIVREGDPGDILIFMPGMGEINATISACRARRLPEPVDLIPLHGDLPPEEQDRAFNPSDRRKIVVSTNVAETSVTIDGIRHVVDSGLARVSRYDAERGVNTLMVEEISRASADQRKGRAGRTASGVCWRLWSESGHLNRPARNTPEIQRADLAEVVLLLHSLGIREASRFGWLDKPDPAAIERAEELLRLLGAIASNPDSAEPSDITPLGRRMLRLPMHPRYSRMLLEASRFGCVPAAALCAALVSGRDLLVRLARDDQRTAENREMFEGNGESDFFVLVRAWEHARRANFSIDECRRYGIHAATARVVGQTFQQILDVARRECQPAGEANPPLPGMTAEEALCRCVAAGFIDQLCVRKDLGTLDCRLTGGRSGTLMRESVVQKSPLLVAATLKEVEGKRGGLTLLGLATAIRPEWIEELLPGRLQRVARYDYDRVQRRVEAFAEVRFLDLVLSKERVSQFEPEMCGLALARAWGEKCFELPQFNHEVRQWVNRVNLLAAALPDLEFPPLDAAAVERRLAKAFHGMTLTKEALEAPLLPSIKRHLAPEQVEWLNELLPTSIRWHDGRQVKLLYPEGDPAGKGEPQWPEFQMKLHECFPLASHPTLAEGRVPVRIWLLAPDGKRIDSTLDWPAFRATQYPKLKSALQKKHAGVAWL